MLCVAGKFIVDTKRTATKNLGTSGGQLEKLEVVPPFILELSPETRRTPKQPLLIPYSYLFASSSTISPPWLTEQQQAAMWTDAIEKPTLILDPTICRANIQRMAERAKRNNVKFRPHSKTHQSAMVSEWFREVGVDAITVSSVEMATYFAENGWKDITIAFTVGPSLVVPTASNSGDLHTVFLTFHIWHIHIHR